MSELVEWYRAQLDEDERVARAAGGEWANGLPATVHPDPTVYRTVTRGVGQVCGSILAADAEHIARHDPATVLRDVAAKRAIVEAYEFVERATEEVRRTAPDYRFVREAEGPRDALLHALRLLAASISDRPGYREEWAL